MLIVSLWPFPCCFMLSIGFCCIRIPRSTFCISHDSRIKAERRSRIKAMEERAKKGVSFLAPTAPFLVNLTYPLQLLSEEEKAALAAEKAKGEDGDCSIQ